MARQQEGALAARLLELVPWMVPGRPSGVVGVGKAQQLTPALRSEAAAGAATRHVQRARREGSGRGGGVVLVLDIGFVLPGGEPVRTGLMLRAHSLPGGPA